MAGSKGRTGRPAGVGSYIRLRGAVWWFRRRAPDDVSESLGRVWTERSLLTSNRPLAMHRSSALSAKLEGIFEMARLDSLAREQARTLLRQSL